MAEIQQAEVVDRIIKGNKLDTARAKIPNNLREDVTPVFNANIPLPKIREMSHITGNNSAVSFIVPKGKTWKILYGHFLFGTTATVGNRTMEILFKDPSGQTLFRMTSPQVQAASLSYSYTFGAFANHLVTSNKIFLAIPFNNYLPEGYSIHFKDISAIDPSADDLTLRFMVEEHDYSMT